MKQNKEHQKINSRDNSSSKINLPKRPYSANKKDSKKYIKSPTNNNTTLNNEKLDFKTLLENENDTYEDLKIKNLKLRKLIIQASNKITELNNHHNKLKKKTKKNPNLTLNKN